MRLSTELAVGLALIAAVVLLALGVRLLGGLPAFGGTVDAYALLDNSGGVDKGSPVIVNGLDVGTVTDVRLTTERQIRVAFSVDPSTDLRSDASVRPGGIAALGGVTLALDPGIASEPLPNGGRVAAGGGSADLLALASDRAPQLLVQIDTLIRVVTRAAQTANAIAAGSQDDAQATLAALRRTTTTLDAFLRQNDQTLARLVRRGDTLSSALTAFATPARTDTLAVALDRLTRLLATAQTTLDASSPTIDGLGRTSARADTLLALLTNGDGLGARVLRDDSLYVQIDTALVRVNRILADFERNPGRYLRHLDLVDLF